MKKINFIIIGIFIFALFLRVGILTQKDDIFYDEVLNMTSVSHNDLYSNRSGYFEKGKSYKGIDIKQKMLVNDASFKSMIYDIKAMHKNGTGDIYHTNFYYSLVRVSLLGVDNYSLNDYLVRVGGLNLILFALSFFIMYKLLNMLFDDRIYTAVGLFIAFINPLAAANTIFLREYQLQELFVVLIFYLGFYYFKNPIKTKDIPIISISMSLALLSGYYIGFFVFCFFMMLLFKRDFKNFSICAVLTLIILLMLYPHYFGIFTSKFIHSQVAQSISAATTAANVAVAEKQTPLLLGIIKYPYVLYNLICSNLLIIYFAWLAYKTPKSGSKKTVLIITGIALIWVVIVLTTCPYRITRYIQPIVPIATLLLTWILACTKSKKAIALVLAVLIFRILLCSLNTLAEVGNLRFKNIKINSMQKLIIEDNKKLPVYIISNNYETMAVLVNHFDDNQEVNFVSSKFEIKDNHYYLCIDDKDVSIEFLGRTLINEQDTGMYYYCMEFSED